MNIPLWLQFKRDTGMTIDQSREFYIHRRKGEWIIDIPDDIAMELGCTIVNYDYMDYVKWLEKKLEQLKKQP